MLKYIIHRLLHIVPILIGITIISFVVINLAPGKSAHLMMMNPRLDFKALEKMKEAEGLNKPLHVRYAYWLKNAVTFNFGRSRVDHRLVTEKIRERLPITVLINILSIVIIFTLSIPIGIKSAVGRGSLFDKTSTVFVFLGFAAPSFWIGLLLMSFFGVRLGIMPISGIVSLDFENYSIARKILDITGHLALPVFVASIGGLAGISRYMRQSMLNAINQDYVRTARAKGLNEFTVIYKHALRNALLPIITIVGLSIPGLLSGSVIIETIFGIPGMGRLMVESVFTRDYNVIMAGLVISAFLTLVGNLVADITYAYVDPRIRYK
ncbi:MAG: ABC transporter permease [Candidatus Omnitrophota bacterium]